jgi:PleD family two-component response regulator
MVKRVVDGHRGVVQVKTAECEGTRFVLTFPAIDVVTAVSTTPRHFTNPSRSPLRMPGSEPPHPSSIVLKNDHSDALQGIALLLQFDGHQVHTCETGTEAIVSIVARPPDVVIADLSGHL